MSESVMDEFESVLNLCLSMGISLKRLWVRDFKEGFFSDKNTECITG